MAATTIDRALNRPNDEVYPEAGAKWLVLNARGVGMEPLVQGLDGALRPGTVLNSEDFHTLGPSLGWAWELGHAHWPRG